MATDISFIVLGVLVLLITVYYLDRNSIDRIGADRRDGYYKYIPLLFILLFTFIVLSSRFRAKLSGMF